MTNQTTNQATNRSLGPMDDLLLTLAEASARTGLTVEALRQRAKRRQLRTVKGNDGLVRLRLSPSDIDRLATMRPTGQPVERPTSQLVERPVADQSVNPGNIGVLERVTTLLREQVELTARLSAELVEERQRRGAAEGNAADLRRQLAELERNLRAARAGTGATSGLASEGDSAVRTAQETRELAEVPNRAKVAEEEQGEAKERARVVEKEHGETADTVGRLLGRGLLARLFNRKLPP